MPPVRPSHSGITTTIVDLLGQLADGIIDRTVEAIFADIPAYAAIRDPAFVRDVREHVAEHHRTLLQGLTAEQTPSREDLLFSRRHTVQRVGRISIADFLQAYRMYLGNALDALLNEIQEHEDAAAVIDLVNVLLDYVNLASTYAAELYIEIEQLELAGGERVRRDLLEDLIASRAVVPGARQDAARDAGLAPDRPCLVIVAIPRTAPGDEQTLRGAAGAIARACHTRKSPLTVIRSDHIVVVSPIRPSDTDRVVQSLNETHARLARRDMRLAIGVSTVQPGLAGIATALLEALGAAQCLGPDGGVFALPALSAFEYLTAFRDATAERLVSPAVTNFVSSDLASGGVLVATLLAYVDCDLNVKALSERISVHVNTAHYRLNKVAEQTGSDLRRLKDVLDLVVAIRFAMSRGDRPPGVWR
jgi:sugar diacid utilization regulator